LLKQLSSIASLMLCTSFLFCTCTLYHNLISGKHLGYIGSNPLDNKKFMKE